MNAYEDATTIGKDALDGAAKSFSVLTSGFQKIAAETSEFTKRSYEESAEVLDQLTRSKSLDRIMELQSDFAKAACQSWMSQATRMGDLCAEIAKEACKPLEGVAAFATRARQPNDMAA